MINKIFKLFSHINSKRKLQILLVLIFMVITALFEVIGISALIPFLGILSNPDEFFNYNLIKLICSKFSITKSQQLILPITIIFVSLTIISGLLRIFLSVIQNKIGFGIGSDLSIKIYSNILNQEYQFHISRNSSEVIANISNKVNGIIQSIIISLLLIASSFFMLLFMLCTLIYINYKITIFSILGFVFVYYIIIRFTKKNLYSNSKIISKNSELLIKNLQEGIGGIRDVILDNSQKIYLENYIGVDKPLRKAQSSVILIGSLPKYAIESIGIVLLTLFAYNYSQNSTNFLSLIPVLGIFALAAQRMLPILQQMYSSLISINGSRHSLEDILSYLHYEDKNLYYEHNITINFNYNIKFENLYFKYNNNQKWILNNINFTINKGDIIGITGTTGSGKSTLLDILMGLLYVNSGNMSVDDIVIDSNNAKKWQKLISHVPQNIFLTDSTIAENIAFGIRSEDIDLELVKVSANLAQISDSISKMEDGYNTIVGERGVKLSGGQKQRIGIARALYKKSEIIIFDEATSSLDSITELKVMKSIAELKEKHTIIIVAHRISTLVNCNKILQFTNGKIIKTGTFSDLYS
jgi:ABC-type multidrug transport system fused ATPase/permease subunit